MNESLDVSAQQTSLMSPLFAEMPIPSQESQRSFTCLLVVSTTQRQQIATIEGMQQMYYWHIGCHQNYHVNGKTKQTTTKYNNIANQSTTPDI
jgi:DNA polymerase III psi subunit